MAFNPINQIAGYERQSVLAYALESNIQNIEQQSKVETNPEKAEALWKRAKKAKDILRKKQKPALKPDELEDVLNEIDRYQHILDKIKTDKLSFTDIQILETSDLQYFLDENFLEELRRIKEKMTTRYSVHNTLSTKKEFELKQQAEKEWKEHTEELQTEIDTLKLKNDRKSQNLVKNLQLEIKKGHKAWTRKRMEEIDAEQYQAFDSVSGIVDLNFLNRLREMLKEAKNIELERIYLSFEEEVRVLQKKLDQSKLQDPLRNHLQSEISKASHKIKERLTQDPRHLKEMVEDFKKGQVVLDNSIQEITYIQNNRETIEKKALEGHQKLAAELYKLTPEILERIKAGLSRENVMDPLFLKPLRHLEALADPNSEVRQKISHWEKTILPNISYIPPEELQAFADDVENFGRMIPLKDILGYLDLIESEDYQSGQAAHISIQGLEKAANIKEIKAILNKNLGLETLGSPHRYDNIINGDKKKHVKVIPSSEFAQYQKHTTGGMVYMERMNGTGTKEWYLFIDEKFLNSNSKEAAIELKKQLTHELLHVEFEKGAMVQDSRGNLTPLKDKFLKEFKAYKKWPEIEAKFRAWMSETGEKDSHGKNDWPTEDILSELYAMQKELGLTKILEGNGHGTGGTLNHLDELNNLIFELNTTRGNKELNLPQQTKERILGYKQIPVEPGYIEAADVGMSGAPKPQELEKPKAISVDVAKQRENKEQINQAYKRLNDLKDYPVSKQIAEAEETIDGMLRFNDRTNQMNEEGDPRYFDQVSERNKELLKDIQELEGVISDFSVQETNTDMSIFRKLWNDTTFLSFQDFITAGTHFIEYWNRRMNRRVEGHAATLNKAIFGGSGMGLEAAAKEQAIEQQEVGEWEGRIDKLDAPQLEGLLQNLAQNPIPDRDRFKAILRTLAQKGRLNWLNQDIWRVLNKLQKLVYFREDDPELLSNPNLLRLKLAKALGNFYDRDEFPSLEQNNASNYESEKSKREAVHKRTPTLLTKRMNDILRRHRSGEEPADPIEYESIIDFCIVQSRSFAENAMFHLMAGMAEGILTPERGQNIASKGYTNSWPPIQWFETIAKPSQAYFKELCEKHFPDDFAAGNLVEEGRGAQFRNWFFTEILNKPAIADRIDKSADKRAWDPDWCRTVTCGGNSEHIRRFFSGQGGQTVVQSAAIAASYVGTLQYLEENAINPSNVGRTDFARIAGNIIMHEGIVDGTAYRSAGDVYSRQVDNNRVPNEASLGRYGGKSLMFHREKLRDFLYQIDPDIFQGLRGVDLTDPRLNKKRGQEVARLLLQKYPGLAKEADIDVEKVERIDYIFDRLRLIMNYIFQQMSEEKFENLKKYVVENLDEPAPTTYIKTWDQQVINLKGKP